MNIQQFQYVLAVAEYRHFSTAAEKCYISQSTLSTMISRLEEELGIVIFDRKKKPVEITIDGHSIIDQLRIIISEIHHLEELVMELKGELSGTVKIACIPTVAPFLLPNVIPDFSNQYPEVILEVKENTTAEIVRQLKSRELDIGIISTPVSEHELTEYPLYTEPFVYYNKSEKPSQKIAVSDITFDNFWLMEEGHCFRDQVLKICGTGKKKINTSNIQFKAGSIGSLLRFVNASNGKTLLPYSSTMSLQTEDKANISFFKNPVPGRTIGLLTHHHFAKKKLLNLLQKAILNKINLIGKPFQTF